MFSLSLYSYFFLHLCTFSELGIASSLTEYLLTECGFSKLQGCSNSTVTFLWFVSLRGRTVYGHNASVVIGFFICSVERFYLTQYYLTILLFLTNAKKYLTS